MMYTAWLNMLPALLVRVAHYLFTYEVSAGTTFISGIALIRRTSSSGACAWYDSISSATRYFCSERRIFSYNYSGEKEFRANS